MLWNYQGLLATKPKYPLNETYSPSWNQPPTLYYPPPSPWNSHSPYPTFFYISWDKLIHYIRIDNYRLISLINLDANVLKQLTNRIKH